MNQRCLSGTVYPVLLIQHRCTLCGLQEELASRIWTSESEAQIKHSVIEIEERCFQVDARTCCSGVAAVPLRRTVFWLLSSSAKPNSHWLPLVLLIFAKQHSLIFQQKVDSLLVNQAYITGGIAWHYQALVLAGLDGQSFSLEFPERTVLNSFIQLDY